MKNKFYFLKIMIENNNKKYDRKRKTVERYKKDVRGGSRNRGVFGRGNKIGRVQLRLGKIQNYNF